jgi:hypothetical protein
MFSKQLNRLTPIDGLPNQFHIFFVPDQRGNTLPNERMIVYRQNPNHFSPAFFRNNPKRNRRPGAT